MQSSFNKKKNNIEGREVIFDESVIIECAHMSVFSNAADTMFKGRVKIYRVPGPGPSTGAEDFFSKKIRGAETFFEKIRGAKTFFQKNLGAKKKPFLKVKK